MDDQVISQTDIIQRPAAVPVADVSERPAHDRSFASLLEHFRAERGWSKADLAKRANLDPSSITRFEQGSRNPDREMVMLIAGALALPLADRDRLLAAAGFRSELWDDPLLVELSQLLTDVNVPSAIRDDVRTILKAALAFGRLGRLESN